MNDREKEAAYFKELCKQKEIPNVFSFYAELLQDGTARGIDVINSVQDFKNKTIQKERSRILKIIDEWSSRHTKSNGEISSDWLENLVKEIKEVEE